MQPYMTALNPSVSFKNFIEQSQPGYIAHCNSGDKKEFSVQSPVEGCVTILIGPEGDFSPAEVAAAAQNGWNPVSLGASRLRTETAGVYACSVIRMHNETSNSH
jgi:16S rRNA (uracil1498-N3)-methyltransferase